MDGIATLICYYRIRYSLFLLVLWPYGQTQRRGWAIGVHVPLWRMLLWLTQIATATREHTRTASSGPKLPLQK
jgi:hypothetical protein